MREKQKEKTIEEMREEAIRPVHLAGRTEMKNMPQRAGRQEPSTRGIPDYYEWRYNRLAEKYDGLVLAKDCLEIKVVILETKLGALELYIDRLYQEIKHKQ